MPMQMLNDIKNYSFLKGNSLDEGAFCLNSTYDYCLNSRFFSRYKVFKTFAPYPFY